MSRRGAADVPATATLTAETGCFRVLALPQLDRESSAPIWFQIMRALEANIADGTWAPGDRLPSENELCAHFSASRTSVRDALAKLESAHLISRRQGKGAFVERHQGPSAWTL